MQKENKNANYEVRGKNPTPFAVALGTPSVSVPSVCGPKSENKQKWKMGISRWWQGSRLKASSLPCVPVPSCAPSVPPVFCNISCSRVGKASEVREW